MHVDLCGVDVHKVDDLKLVTVGAVVETQKGPIIIIMNQCARTANGKMIHSSGQMEHHKIIVKDQAHAITNGITTHTLSFTKDIGHHCASSMDSHT